jgi:hypothetical protein
MGFGRLLRMGARALEKSERNARATVRANERSRQVRERADIRDQNKLVKEVMTMGRRAERALDYAKNSKSMKTRVKYVGLLRLELVGLSQIKRKNSEWIDMPNLESYNRQLLEIERELRAKRIKEN